MAEAATIQVLLDNLLNISQVQIGLVKNFKNDLKSLLEIISMVNDFMHDAEKRQFTNKAVKRWLRELEAVAFEADNVFDDISYQLLSKKVGRPTGTLKKKVQSFFVCSSDNPVAYRLKLGRRIKDIKEKLKSINQYATELGLQTRVANAQPPVFESLETADPVYGRENDVPRIVETLITTTNPTGQVLSVLPIVGMDGLGKTTLARKVFSDEQIISHFGGNRVWVHVPRIFNVRNILRNILTSLPNVKVELETTQDLLQKLQEYLGTKRYMLVLDDVWNDDREVWGDFINFLMGVSSVAGNCIIVTSRSELVASIVGTLPVYKLESLSEDDCWSIIKAKAFNRSEYDPLEFEAMGKNIAKRCGGLPLAAKVVGGLLRGRTKDDWLEIEKNWLSDFGYDENPISKILKLSIDHLSPPSLKKCFAYCSIFPIGYPIEKEQVIELWMAEGFIQTEIMGSNFFNLLLQNSLLQVARSDDYDNITHGYMNDLVHDLARPILVNDGNVTGDICQSRYIGYKPGGDGFLSFPAGQEKYVRTLFFGGEVSDIQFSDFESLRSLTLVGHHTNELPTSIRELKHLRYLDISETSIEYLPDSVGELYHLQTLREKNDVIWRQCYLEKLPESLSCLVSLRHLHISEYTKLPLEIGKLNSLQTLSCFHVDSEKGYEISELGSLKNLKGKLDIYNLENVRDREAALSADLHGKAGIYELKLEWNSDREGDEANDESVLEGLQPHPNLKGLEICGFKGKSLSLWEGLNNLMEIKLTDCSECEELPCLGGGGAPSRLRKLRIINCRSLRELPDDVHSLNSLEALYISECPDLKSIPYPSGGGGGQQWGFTSLRQLHISNCEGLTDLPTEMVESCAASLEELRLNWLGNIRNFGMVNGCLNRMTRLRELEIMGVPEFSIIGSLSTNNSLQTLVISPSSSWNDNVSFNETVDAMLRQFISLRSLVLRGKEDWGSLPDQLQHHTSLEELTLDGFGIESLPEWFGNLSSLKELILSDCKKLRHLPSKQAMHRLSNLTLLEIKRCPLLLKEKRRNNKIYYYYYYNHDYDYDYDYDPIPQIDDSEWPKIFHIPTIKLDGCQVHPANK